VLIYEADWSIAVAGVGGLAIVALSLKNMDFRYSGFVAKSVLPIRHGGCMIRVVMFRCSCEPVACLLLAKRESGTSAAAMFRQLIPHSPRRAFRGLRRFLHTMDTGSPSENTIHNTRSRLHVSRDRFTDGQTGASSDAVRFVAAGIVNTVLSFLAYEAALHWLRPTQAYAVGWLVGLMFLIKFYPERVFVGGYTAWTRRLWLAVTYIGVFALGVVTLDAVVSWTSAPTFAVIVTIGVTTTLNFVLSRALLRGI
jgi:hypothetical protein